MSKGPLIEGSSLKNFNFTGWTADQILEKYENVLETRERQITDLTIEMGTLNEALNCYMDKCTSYVEENDLIKTKLKKKEAQLAQELTNKEILFMKLDRKEVECDELNRKYNELLKGRPISFSSSKGKADYLKVNEVSEVIQSKGIPKSLTSEAGNAKDIIVSGSKEGTVGETQQTTVKTSARNKIEKLKTKTGNATKINFSNLFEAQREKAKEKSEPQQVNQPGTQEDNTLAQPSQPELTSEEDKVKTAEDNQQPEKSNETVNE